MLSRLVDRYKMHKKHSCVYIIYYGNSVIAVNSQASTSEGGGVFDSKAILDRNQKTHKKYYGRFIIDYSIPGFTALHPTKIRYSSIIEFQVDIQ